MKFTYEHKNENMILKFSLFRIQKKFKTIKNVIGRMKKATKLFNYFVWCTPTPPSPVRCYPVLRYASGSGSGTNAYIKLLSTCLDMFGHFGSAKMYH